MKFTLVVRIICRYVWVYKKLAVKFVDIFLCHSCFFRKSCQGQDRKEYYNEILCIWTIYQSGNLMDKEIQMLYDVTCVLCISTLLFLPKYLCPPNMARVRVWDMYLTPIFNLDTWVLKSFYDIWRRNSHMSICNICIYIYMSVHHLSSVYSNLIFGYISQ